MAALYEAALIDDGTFTKSINTFGLSKIFYTNQAADTRPIIIQLNGLLQFGKVNDYFAVIVAVWLPCPLSRIWPCDQSFL